MTCTLQREYTNFSISIAVMYIIRYQTSSVWYGANASALTFYRWLCSSEFTWAELRQCSSKRARLSPQNQFKTNQAGSCSCNTCPVRQKCIMGSFIYFTQFLETWLLFIWSYIMYLMLGLVLWTIITRCIIGPSFGPMGSCLVVMLTPPSNRLSMF